MRVGSLLLSQGDCHSYRGCLGFEVSVHGRGWFGRVRGGRFVRGNGCQQAHHPPQEDERGKDQSHAEGSNLEGLNKCIAHVDIHLTMDNRRQTMVRGPLSVVYTGIFPCLRGGAGAYLSRNADKAAMSFGRDSR